MAWQLQDAKQRLSEVVRKALEEGPQIVTRHGRDAVVVVSMTEFKRLKGGGSDFKQMLRRGPELAGLKIARDRRKARRVKL